MYKDKSILIKIKAGEQIGCTELLSIYYARIFAYVARRLKPVEDAEDIVSEVFTRFLSMVQEGKISLETPVEPYLYRMAKNKIIDNYRRKKVDFVSLDEGHNSLIWGVGDVEQEYASNIDLKKNRDCLELLFNGLNLTEKKVIRLRHLDGHSLVEISEQLKMNYSTVKMAHSRGMAKMIKNRGAFTNCIGNKDINYGLFR